MPVPESSDGCATGAMPSIAGAVIDVIDSAAVEWPAPGGGSATWCMPSTDSVSAHSSSTCRARKAVPGRMPPTVAEGIRGARVDIRDW